MFPNANYRMFYQVILCFIGFLFAILGFVEEINNTLFTIGVALFICSGLRIIRDIKMHKNHEYRDKVMIAHTDERNIKISEKAGSFAFRFAMLVLCIIELCLIAFELAEIATMVGYVVCFMLVVYWVTYLIYMKKY